MTHALTAIGSSTRDMARVLLKYRNILRSITSVELAKRYSGSSFGKVWIFLYPALLLSIYLFVYMVIFKMRFPGYSQLDYVLYVFCGLIPFIGISESLSTGCQAIKQNMHLVRNLLLPIELLPVRCVAVSMVNQLVSMAILLILTAIGGHLSLHILWLPAVIVLQVMFLVGLVWILSALSVALPDVGYFVNLTLLLLMFVSPIGFKPDMVPPALQFVVWLNPVSYLIEAYRSCMIYGQFPSTAVVLVYIVLCTVVFALGSAFFRKFKLIIVDFE